MEVVEASMELVEASMELVEASMKVVEASTYFNEKSQKCTRRKKLHERPRKTNARTAVLLIDYCTFDYGTSTYLLRPFSIPSVHTLRRSFPPILQPTTCCRTIID